MVAPLHSFIAKEDRAEVAALYRVERFWSCVETSPEPDACWPWRGQIDRNGYGIFPDGGHTALAHRVAFTLAYGEDPGDLPLDHVCHSSDQSCLGGVDCPHRRCVRPSHLEPVETAENVRRAIRQMAEAARRRNGKRGTCKNGHDWIPENILVKKDGAKRCRICHREDVRQAAARMRARKKEALLQSQDSGGAP